MLKVWYHFVELLNCWMRMESFRSLPISSSLKSSQIYPSGSLFFLNLRLLKSGLFFLIAAWSLSLNSITFKSKISSTSFWLAFSSFCEQNVEESLSSFHLGWLLLFLLYFWPQMEGFGLFGISLPHFLPNVCVLCSSYIISNINTFF